jgi:hypothetical protein
MPIRNNRNKVNTMKATQETTATEVTEYPAAQMALASYLECEPDELTEESYQLYDALAIYSHGNAEYAVGTDAEADEAWEASLESYLEECVYPELPETMKNYFDDEAWKRDARFDGRGHSLSSYDGNENEAEADGETFYIFRIN